MLRLTLILLILVIVVIGLLTWSFNHFEQEYYRDVHLALQKNKAPASDLLLEKDLKHLPAPVQRYLRYVGVVNQPKRLRFLTTCVCWRRQP
jgi:hypothetical protein